MKNPMKKSFRSRLSRSFALPVLICALCSGCAGYGSLSRNLAKDGAIVRAEIGTPWGVQKILRIGSTTNAVLIGPDGTVVINPAGNAQMANGKAPLPGPLPSEGRGETNEAPRIVFIQVPGLAGQATTNAPPTVSTNAPLPVPLPALQGEGIPMGVVSDVLTGDGETIEAR